MMPPALHESAPSRGVGLQRPSRPNTPLRRGEPLLEIEDLTLDFGGIRALDGVRLNVQPGSIHAVIGPKGAGKSSLLECICGLYRPQQGRIALQRETQTRELLGLPPHEIARLGVARCCQNSELFRQLSVLENLMLGRHVHMNPELLPSLLWFFRARRQEINHRALIEEVIELLGLQAVRHQPVATLSYGHARRVELGRALCLEPALLLLDEPMAGLNAEEQEAMACSILDINELLGTTIVLTEQDLHGVMDISHRVSVLDFGRLLAEDTPSEVARAPGRARLEPTLRRFTSR